MFFGKALYLSLGSTKVRNFPNRSFVPKCLSGDANSSSSWAKRGPLCGVTLHDLEKSEYAKVPSPKASTDCTPFNP